jgi:tetratricopeptide (TPR) repeat protein
MSDKKPKPVRQSKPKKTPLGPRNIDQILSAMEKALEAGGLESPEEMNAFLRGVMESGEGIPEPVSRNAIDRAQDVMYKAWEARGPKRVQLAHKALEISPDCADAYCLLAAEAARTTEERKELYEKGVKAGEQAIGAEFEELTGQFWGFLETRPYMRARAGLAGVLWRMGEREAAIEHYRDMLRLNPNDNQGIRYLLLDCYMESGRLKDAEKLLKQYKDDAGARWLYTAALLTFSKAGASPKANQQLQQALDHNPFVPTYLLGKKKLPRIMPAYIGFGDDNEAIDYATNGVLIWGRNKEALVWLAGMVAGKNAGKD